MVLAQKKMTGGEPSRDVDNENDRNERNNEDAEDESTANSRVFSQTPNGHGCSGSSEPKNNPLLYRMGCNKLLSGEYAIALGSKFGVGTDMV